VNEPKRGNAASIDIDALLQNTWLQVISLRHGPQFRDEEGYTLWQRCIADVERVQHELKASGLDDASCQHILTAQCALLDEAVKGRGVEDEACLQWYDIPLQGHFLGTMDAGDTLCERMRDVLREPAPRPGRGHLFSAGDAAGFCWQLSLPQRPRAPEAGQRAQ
jgi:type VI secretion system protein ImpK